MTPRRLFRRTHCRAGHPYTRANTYVWRNRAGVEQRQCRTCKREKQRARREGETRERVAFFAQRRAA